MICDFSKAKIVVAFDSDFLYAHPYALRYARDFANGRRVIEPDGARMNRFYAAEPTPPSPDPTPIIASQCLPGIFWHWRKKSPLTSAWLQRLRQVENEDWIGAVVHDLQANRGQSVFIAGETQPPELHVWWRKLTPRSEHRPDNFAGAGFILAQKQDPFRELAEEMRRGAVELLIVFGGNPRYDAPADFNFADAFDKVKLRVHHSVHFNETSRHSHWQVPAAHFLESWSDTRAFDGSMSIVQPLIETMYAGVSAHEILEAVSERSLRTVYEIVRSHWSGPQPVPTSTPNGEKLSAMECWGTWNFSPCAQRVCNPLKTTFPS